MKRNNNKQLRKDLRKYQQTIDNLMDIDKSAYEQGRDDERHEIIQNIKRVLKELENNVK